MPDEPRLVRHQLAWLPPGAPLLELALDGPSRVQQLYDYLRQLVLDGHLPAGTRLPATRQLAGELELSRNTVMHAFERLGAEGFVVSQVGVGTEVAAVVPAPKGRAGRADADHKEANRTDPWASLSQRGQRVAAEGRSIPSSRDRYLFQPGLPDVSEFPRLAWNRSLTRRAKQFAFELSGYAHAGGYMPLRESLARYLCVARGVRCEPEQVLITTSAQAALDLATRCLSDAGERAWIECPGYVGARAAFVANGLQLVPLAVDECGVCLSSLEEAEAHGGPCRLGYTTPSHQFPLGVTLSLERRLGLLEWADRAAGWILEDDYDSEFRYRGAPIAAIQGLVAQTRVIYVGSFAKTLFPGLRVAYLVVPRALVEALARALRQTGQEPALMLQAALHDFIEEGSFARHLKRMREIYARRHDAVAASLNEHLSWLGAVADVDGGLQLALQFAAEHDDVALATRARSIGFGPEALSRYSVSLQPTRGLLFGLGAIGEHPLEQQIEALSRLYLGPPMTRSIDSEPGPFTTRNNSGNIQSQR